MIKLKPIALAVMGCGLLQGCGAPPPARPLAVQAVVRGEMPGNQAASWNRLARFHHERGQLALALGAYAQSLALDANQLEARNAVAVIEAQQGNLESARKALVALVNDYPGEAQPHTNLGYVQYLMGDHAGASQTLRRAMALGAGPKAFQNLQLAEAAMGRTPTAEDVQLAAAKAAPRAATQPALTAAPAAAASSAAPSVVAAAAPSVTTAANPAAAAPAVAAAPASVAAPSALASAAPSAAPAAAAASAEEASPVLPASPARTLAAPLAATPLTPAKPALAMALPEKPSVARSAPEQLTALPNSREIASHMELVKLNANVYELRARVAADPAAVPPAAAAPVVAAVAPKPAVQAVAQADKVRMARLEVSNGNGVAGMARRFRRLLGQIGIPVDRLSNDKPYKQVATTIQYSPGFEKQAVSLQKALQGKAQLTSKQLAASDVRLVLGKDAQVSLTAVTEAAGLSLVAMQEDSQH